MPGSFVLTMWARSQVHHFQIVGHGNAWYSVDNGPLFQGVDELIKYYLIKSDGLPSKLHEFVIGSPLPLAARKRVSTEYHQAARKGDVVLLKRLLSQQSSVSVDSQDPDGATPVHIAATKGDIKVLLLLLDYKPDMNIRDSKGSTALYVSCSPGLFILLCSNSLIGVW